MGVSASSFAVSSALSMSGLMNGVLVQVGATALTRMFRGAHSTAMLRTRLTSAPLVVA